MWTCLEQQHWAPPTGLAALAPSQAKFENQALVPPAKTYLFDARLNEDHKLLIQRAADLEGRTMTDFVLCSAEAAAERMIEKSRHLGFDGTSDRGVR